MIDRYKNGLLETQNLQISNENLSDETICNEFLYSSTFKNLSLINLNFTDVNFESSFFKECLFKDCIFDSTSLSDAKFKNCTLTNCHLKNCNLSEVDFTETTFDKCCFERTTKGSLIKACFESCHFLETNFNGFEGASLIQTVVVDSKFSNSQTSIEFKGDFFLIHILQPVSDLMGVTPITPIDETSKDLE